MRLIYQDQQILVVHKPSGWTIYEEQGVPKEYQLHAVCTSMLMEDLHPVHRLDRPTCGLVVFAGSGRWARLLQEQFMGREVKKTYQALVHGHIDGSRKIDIKLKEKGKGEQTAVSNIKSLTKGSLAGFPVTLLELMPETGRYHQLRKHCKLIGHPIVGDSQYGLTEQDKKIADNLQLRLMLTAIKLSFSHPKSKRLLNLEDTPDQSYLNVLQAAGLDLKKGGNQKSVRQKSGKKSGRGKR